MKPRTVSFAIAALSLLGLAVGCSKHNAAPGSAAVPGASGAPAAAERPHVDGTPHTDKAVDAWKGAGLATEAFQSIDPGAYRAGYCSQGRVAGIDVLVCEYADDESLDSAKKMIQAEWNKEGIHTGVAVRTGRTLLAVADRAKTDPNGKTINKVVTTFKHL